MLCYPRNIRHVFICGILVTISVLVPRSVLASEFSVPSERVVQDRLSEFAEFKNRSIVEFQPFRAAQQVSDPSNTFGTSSTRKWTMDGLKEISLAGTAAPRIR